MILDFNGPITWSPGTTLDQIERQVILKAYRFYQFNKTTTAKALGIAIRTLDAKLERYEQDEREQIKREEERRARAEEFARRERGFGGSIQYPAIGDAVKAIRDGERERTPEPQTSISTDSGIRMEPTQGDSTQPPVPMPERPKIQEMLPKHAPRGRPRKSGPAFQDPDDAA